MERERDENWVRAMGRGNLTWQVLEKPKNFLSASGFNLYYSQTRTMHGEATEFDKEKKNYIQLNWKPLKEEIKIQEKNSSIQRNASTKFTSLFNHSENTTNCSKPKN